jgi:hypothetical protein
MAVMSLALTACSAQPGSPSEATPSPSAVASAIPSVSRPPGCPNQEGGPCLGTLTAGTYSTRIFLPRITYTVPAGWQNLEDLPGNFLLVPPGYDLAGVNEGESEMIGIYSSVVASSRECHADGQPAQAMPGVAVTPDAIAAEFDKRPGVVSTTSQPAAVGGLSGLVLDLSLTDGWTGTCFNAIYVPLINGVAPSGFDHGLSPHETMRLYLLSTATGVLAIEVRDYSAGAHLDGYSTIVDQIRFGV